MNPFAELLFPIMIALASFAIFAACAGLYMLIEDFLIWSKWEARHWLYRLGRRL